MVEMPGFFELYGAVKLYSLARVLELDAAGADERGVYVLSPSEAEERLPQLTIVIPIKNDEIMSLAGVVSGVPHAARLVIVSASSRSPVDRYRHEVELVRAVHEKTGRGVLILHQRDPAWGEALQGTPLEAILDDNGLVRYGKGEGMLLGLLAAAWLGTRYVGFIDSDNYVPGSVHEYAMAYLTGFKMASSRYAMVRIKWPYKGKLPGISGDVYLRRRGRVSMHTNRVINLALSVMRGIETEIIQTANSGEHALTLDLGLRMEWAGGFAVEPYQLVSLLRDCWLQASERCSFLEGVEVAQVETRNPHLHAERGDEHLASMLAESLGTIYHSPLAGGRIREEILHLLSEQGYSGEPPAPRVYPPPAEAGNPRSLFEAYMSASKEALYLEPL